MVLILLSLLAVWLILRARDIFIHVLYLFFVSGWGPGGQAVNKTTNAVFLKHIPTGLNQTHSKITWQIINMLLEKT